MRHIDRVGAAATLALPLFLLHGRGVAEGLIGVIGALFLLRSALAADWSWTRRVWVRIALLWWAWLIVCTADDGWWSAMQAGFAGRFLLLVAALEHWTLRDDTVRIWLTRLLRWSALYLALQSLLQFAIGRNAFGWPRGADGELTGPYKNPRAGAPLSRLLFPAVLGGRWMAVLLPAGVVVVLLIGQRMPLLLTLLGLFVTALLLPRLRSVVLGVYILAMALMTALPAVSPPTFNRLVTKFSAQMEHFPQSHYGQIAARALAIAQAKPLLGAGFDGFRRDCEDPAFFRGWDGGDGGGAAMCVQHPHNHYLQALVEGGVPGLLLFCALVLAWLSRLARGLWHAPDPLRVGLFVAALIHLWPVSSTTAFTSMPLGGWFFVLLGLGLAVTQHYIIGPMDERA